MRWLSKLPVQWKLALITVVTSAMVELLAVGAILLYSSHEYRLGKTEQFAAEAQVLSANLTAPLAFGDVEGVRGYLDSLSANEEIAAAGVYDAHGALVVSYIRPGVPARLPKIAEPAGQAFDGAILKVSHAVRRAKTNVGSLYLVINTDTFATQLARFFGGFALFAIIGSLLIALPVSIRLNATITGAIRDIAQAAARVKAGDLDFEPPPTQRSDEIGVLITAFSQMMASLRETLQQERLRALGAMSSGIAHDINNALSPMALYTQSLLEAPQDERMRRYLETVKRVTADITATVGRMRDFSRPREPQLMLAPVDLNQMAHQVFDLTRVRWTDMQHQKGVVIDGRLELEEGLPIVMGIESEIREALTNLIFNAIDAMPDGGTLRLRTQSVGASHVRVDVIDSGMGMDEATRLRCFEPFYTTKGDRGTGLGMAMVYGAVKRHSAEIEIESEPGKGTLVRLTFLAHAEIATPKPRAGTALPPPMRILVTDDNPSVLESLGVVLELDGHMVVPAMGGQAAIDIFTARHAAGRPFDAVITDLGMPHVDGNQVARAVKELAPQAYVILLTGWGRRMTAQGEAPRNVDQILGKPPELDELRAALLECSKRASWLRRAQSA